MSVVSNNPQESAGSDATTTESGRSTPTSGSHEAPHGAEHESTGDTRFHVIGEVGEGGMALVHLALAQSPSGDDKLVVLKTLRSNLASDPECVAMFQHEARLAARLDHPNVVRTYEVVRDHGHIAIVMEYLEGQPLSHVVSRAKREARLPLDMHLRAICDALAGLHYAHELTDFDGKPLGLIHRDVTPHNVFITFDGEVKLLDFGIAKVQTSASAQTEFGVLKGKVLYMAPEQLTGDRIDRRVDLYAVGAMLWEALAGERIWFGMADFVAMQQVVEGKIPSPRTRNPDVPAVLEAICMKAMAHRAADRYATAEEFRSALQAAAFAGETQDANGENREGRLRPAPRDLGGYVAELFAETRAAIKAAINEQMDRLAALSTSDAENLEPVVLPHWESAAPLAESRRLRADGNAHRGQAAPPVAPSDAPGSAHREAIPEASDSRPRVPRRGWIALALIAAALVLAAWSWIAAAPLLPR